MSKENVFIIGLLAGMLLAAFIGIAVKSSGGLIHLNKKQWTPSDYELTVRGKKVDTIWIYKY